MKHYCLVQGIQLYLLSHPKDHTYTQFDCSFLFSSQTNKHKNEIFKLAMIMTILKSAAIIMAYDTVQASQFSFPDSKYIEFELSYRILKVILTRNFGTPIILMQKFLGLQYTCTYTHVYIHVCMYVYVYIRIYANIHVHVHICVCACRYIYILILSTVICFFSS